MTKELKKYLPYFQFCAVVITIALGVHTTLDRFIKPDGPAVKFIDDSFSITQVKEHGHEGHWEVRFKKVHPRKDCKLFDEVAYVEDSMGFRYDVRTTTRKATDDGPKIDPSVVHEYTFHFAVDSHDAKEAIKKGVNRFGIVKQFRCSDGNQVVEFPEVDGLLFKVEAPTHSTGKK